jgi:hypothetical protein
MATCVLPLNHPLPDETLAWVTSLIASLSATPGKAMPPPIILQDSSTFISRIPPEIRLQILGYLLGGDVKLKYEDYQLKWSDDGSMNIAQACRQLRYEALTIFYKNATISLDDIAMLAIRNERGLFNRDLIQRVEFTPVTDNVSVSVEPWRRSLALYHSLLHTLEAFPSLKHLSCSTRVSLKAVEKVGTNSREHYVQEILAKAQSGERVFTSVTKRPLNGMLLMLARDLCAAVQGRDDLLIDFRLRMRVTLEKSASATNWDDSVAGDVTDGQVSLQQPRRS